jgi:hypothetical protein
MLLVVLPRWIRADARRGFKDRVPSRRRRDMNPAARAPRICDTTRIAGGLTNGDCE